MPKNDEQIGLKDLLEKLKSWINYLKTKWIILVIFGLAGGLLGFLYASFKKPEYAANLTFVLTSNSKTGSLASIAGQLGFDLGGSNDDAFAGDNITELLKSERIVKGAFFRKIPSVSKTLINHFLEESEYKKTFRDKDRAENLLPFPDSAQNLTPAQDSLITELYESVAKNYLTIDKVDKKLSFYYVNAKCEYSDISYYLTKYIAEEASIFYIETKTKLARKNLAMLQHESDSLRNLLDNTITTAGSSADQTFNMNQAYQVQRSSVQQQQIRLNALGAAYAEIVKNLELAKISLEKETPLYQVIDSPIIRLKKLKSSRLLGAFFGGAALIFITSLVLLNKKQKNRI